MVAVASMLGLVAVYGSYLLGSTAIAIQQKPVKEVKGSHESHSHEGKHTPTLPAVADVLVQPRRVYSDLSNKIAALEASLNEAQKHSDEIVSKKRAHYVVLLTQQKNATETVLRSAGAFEKEAEVLQAHGVELRTEAEHLGKKSAALITDVKLVSSNLSSAMEFSKKTIDTAAGELTDSSSFDVLSELRKLDADSAAAEAHAHRLRVIGHGVAALLQLDSHRGKELTTEGMLGDLANSFTDLATERDNSLMQLNATFQQAFSRGQSRLSDAVARQSRANETVIQATQLNKRLKKAVAQARMTHDSLLQRATALRAFAKRIGLQALPETPKVSLAQTHKKSRARATAPVAVARSATDSGIAPTRQRL